MADKQTIDTYNKIAEEFHKRNAKSIWTKEYQTFAQLMGDRKDILEIGCGTGRDAEELIGLGFNYTGIDASEGMLKLAQERIPQGKFQPGDFFKLDFADNSFEKTAFISMKAVCFCVVQSRTLTLMSFQSSISVSAR